MTITQLIDCEIRTHLEGTAFPLADANGNAVTYLDETGNVPEGQNIRRKTNIADEPMF